MCGRYVLAMRCGQICRVLEENGMVIDEYPSDGEHEHERGDGGGSGDDVEASNSQKEPPFRPSYNVAPGYQGIVCRGTALRKRKGKAAQETDDAAEPPDGMQHPLHYKLQTMKWGLIPSWTKQRPDYGAMLKTINCRSDSLAKGGMWASMRGRKRCVVVAQGFYEWLKAGPKERVPYYTRRRDGKPLLLAGLWDCASFDDGGDDEPKAKSYTYTYTIVTTDANKQMRFLHDRMPVMFDLNSAALRTWLEPSLSEWSGTLQALLRPWPDDGPVLDIDAVSKEVNKVGHSSPSFIVPVASSANRANIANFFSGQRDKANEALKETGSPASKRKPADVGQHSPEEEEPPHKKGQRSAELLPSFQGSPKKTVSPAKHTAKPSKRSPPANGSRKITSFFAPPER